MEAKEHPKSRAVITNFIQALVTAVASIFLAFLLPALPGLVRNVHASSQTGLTAVAGGLLEAAFSPWFWLVFLISFSWFYTVSRSTRLRCE
jgi:hypothetical protein